MRNATEMINSREFLKILSSHSLFAFILGAQVLSKSTLSRGRIIFSQTAKFRLHEINCGEKKRNSSVNIIFPAKLGQ